MRLSGPSTLIRLPSGLSNLAVRHRVSSAAAAKGRERHVKPPWAAVRGFRLKIANTAGASAAQPPAVVSADGDDRRHIDLPAALPLRARPGIAMAFIIALPNASRAEE
ncbi:hypothetical protein VFPBJ_01472 [Purpureocillium lilacinum]|uniref:Uncharacterized protein n=1 Tax=Purpureocillium lilacinum TaxID=33203 RepID=A0A179HBV4_PURLI|nr:hypothetical protein VFPBJ_01472 [Purpureocillium lilacinum]